MNRLAYETSPYLQQHKDNPVEWYPWGEDAFQRAREEDKPILLSVGYSTCHWCHVMAHESFENEETARLMNEHFVNVKVDREERPDVDGVYMTAVQATTGAGGWPMTVFLTPDGQPFYAGTYYPPRDAYGRPGFPRVLQSVAEAWRERRQDLLQNADLITRHVREQAAEERPDRALPATFEQEALQRLRAHFDEQHGGFGNAPKFPSPTTLAYLLTRPAGRDMALVTLERMALGGLYDQLGGGFHRYSVDERWLVPHFEKMLYDNAQLARAYLHAAQLSSDPVYLRTVRETLAYLEREMLSGEGGFYSAQDADSEGIEGRFFVWTPDEIRDVLGEDADVALTYWGVTDAGNFEDPHHPEFGRRSVLSVQMRPSELARRLDRDPQEFRTYLGELKMRLLEARELRVRPGTDEKVLTSWNGLAVAAFAEAGRVLGEAHYVDIARQNANFAWTMLRSEDGSLFHTYKDGQARVTGLLEDQALYALGLLELYRATGEFTWLTWARDLWDVIVRDYWDETAGAFWSTSTGAEALIARQQHAFDAAVISENAAAAQLGAWMTRYFGDENGERIARRVVRSFAEEMTSVPSGFGGLWFAHALTESLPSEVAIVGGPEARAPLERVIGRFFLPFTVLAPSAGGGGLPLLEGRSGDGVAYVCRNFACDLPARDEATLAEQLGDIVGREPQRA